MKNEMKKWIKRFIWANILLCEIIFLVCILVRYGPQNGNANSVSVLENTSVKSSDIDKVNSLEEASTLETKNSPAECSRLEARISTEQDSNLEAESSTEQGSNLEVESPTEQGSNLEVESPTEQGSNLEVESPTEQGSNLEAEEITTPEPQNEQYRPIICIDPGHYQGANHVSAENGYEYAEGDFTLLIGLELKRILEEEYGLKVYLTRDTNHITLGGYTDSALDRGHISLRGKHAADMGCDFFISLHTNANDENANGYPTCQQPKEITKTLVIANQLCIQSDKWLNVANAIGENVTKANYQLGLCPLGEFERVDSQSVSQWTTEWNDALLTRGTVKCKTTNGKESYGVLRGSNEANVPGIIVEHAYHTVAEMGKASTEQDLALIWARADAIGIVEGLGLQK